MLNLLDKGRIQAWQWALGVAVLLNLDKILLGPLAPVRCYDTFDGPIPAAQAIARNILRFGLVSQSPESVCGVSNHTLGLPPALVGTMFLLPPYLSYLFLSLTVIFIAFLGMYLFLSNDFKVSREASLIGALFFSSITVHLPMMISVVGIPLLVWCLNRILSRQYAFWQRVGMYFFILIYLMSSCFFLMAPVFLVFAPVYWLFFSKAGQTRENLLVMALIGVLYGLINLPSLTELLTHLPVSHRVAWQPNPDMSWLYAMKYLIRSSFNIHLQDFYTPSPSLLGLLLISVYLFSSRKNERNKYFFFPLVVVLFIETASFFLFQSPLWSALSGYLGFFKSFQLDRFAYLLVVLFSILIAQSSDSLIKRGWAWDKKAWLFSILALAFYIGLGVGFKQFPYNFYPTFIHAARALLEFALQFISVLLLLALIILGVKKAGRFSVFHALFFSFLFFALANAALIRISFGTENFSHYYQWPQIDQLKAVEAGHLEGFRVADIGGADQSKLLISGFKCADGYVNVYPASYKEYWTKVIERELNRSQKSRDYFLGMCNRVYLYDEGIKKCPIKKLGFNPDLLRLINVKYLFSDQPILEFEKYGFTLVAGKSEEVARAPIWKKYFYKKELFIYQTGYFAPSFFLTDKVALFDKKEELLEDLGKRDFAYLAEHTLALRKDFPNDASLALNKEHADILRCEGTPDKSTVWLQNPQPVLLNWTTNINRNWSCEIDGIKTPLRTIYNSFIGVVVPANSRVVRFRYNNDALNAAYLVSLLGFLIINLFVIRFIKNA